jgi:NAD(P)H dehydrogenase (quinone)
VTTIAVLGATGTIGRHIAAGLADRGVDARAVVRDPSRTDVPLPLVHGDLTQPDTLRTAFEGVERLLLLAPHGPDQDLQEAAALDAARAAGMKRIVKISGGAPSLGPNGPSPTAVAHWRTERLIEDSGLDWTFLRPGFVMQNLTTMPLTAGFLLAPMGHAQIAMVDARDIAACAVAALTGEDALGAWHLTGPAGVTFDDAARELGARRYVNVPPRFAAKALRKRGATDFEVEHAIGMARYFASGADGAPTDDVRRLTGHAPRSLEQFFKDQKGT